MSFIDHFDSLEDTRSHINKKYELLDIIFLTVVAMLSGAEGWKDIKQFDGKTLRDSFDGDRKTAIHSVSAYSVEQGLVLAQCKSKSKKNEVSAVMELIELLELKCDHSRCDALFEKSHQIR